MLFVCLRQKLDCTKVVGVTILLRQSLKVWEKETLKLDTFLSMNV